MVLAAWKRAEHSSSHAGWEAGCSAPLLVEDTPGRRNFEALSGLCNASAVMIMIRRNVAFLKNKSNHLKFKTRPAPAVAPSSRHPTQPGTQAPLHGALLLSQASHALLSSKLNHSRTPLAAVRLLHMLLLHSQQPPQLPRSRHTSHASTALCSIACSDCKPKRSSPASPMQSNTASATEKSSFCVSCVCRRSGSRFGGHARAGLLWCASSTL